MGAGDLSCILKNELGFKRRTEGRAGLAHWKESKHQRKHEESRGSTARTRVHLTSFPSLNKSPKRDLQEVTPLQALRKEVGWAGARPRSAFRGVPHRLRPTPQHKEPGPGLRTCSSRSPGTRNHREHSPLDHSDHGLHGQRPGQHHVGHHLNR